MKICVIGVGGIGSYYLGRLSEAGHDVTAIARGRHLRALNTHGLRLEHPERSSQQKFIASKVLLALNTRDSSGVTVVRPSARRYHPVVAGTMPSPTLRLSPEP